MVCNVNQFDLLSNSIWFTQQINLIYFVIQFDLQWKEASFTKVGVTDGKSKRHLLLKEMPSLNLSIYQPIYQRTIDCMSERYALSLIDWQIFLDFKNLGIFYAPGLPVRRCRGRGSRCTLRSFYVPYFINYFISLGVTPNSSLKYLEKSRGELKPTW